MSAHSALLVLPGLGLGREAWLPTLRHLAPGRRTIAWPLPGYGLPPRPGTDLRVDALAAEVVGALPADVRHVVVLGHSASCQVAAHVAALAPDRVTGLVLVGPTTDPRAASWPALASRWLATARHEDPRQAPALARQYSRTTLRGMARGLEAARHDQICETLARTSARVLVVRGVHDRICPVEWGGTVAAAAPGGGSLVTLPSGGHMVPSTHGPLVAAEVNAFTAGDAPALSA